MSHRRFLWFLIAFTAAAGTFFSVRAGFSKATEVPGPLARTSVPPSGAGFSAEIDAALGGAGKAEDAMERRLRFLDLIDKAGPGDLRLMFLSGRSTRMEKRSIAQRWAETDAPGLCDFLKGMGRNEWDRDTLQYETMVGLLFRNWALQDADAALAAAAALNHRPQFRSAQWAIVSTLFGTDPAKAFSLAGKLGNHYDRNQDPLVPGMWTKDPAAFLKMAGEGPVSAWPNSHVHGAVEEAFALLAKRDAPAAAAWLKARSVEQQRVFIGPMAFRFAEVDPTAAAAWFKDMPPSPEREKAGAEIVRGWAKTDPRAALEWLQDNLEGGRTQAFTHLAGSLVEKGVESAKQLLEAMPPGAQRDGVVGVIANKWAEKDFKPAISWVLSLPPDDPGRRNAIQQLAWQWADKDLAGAAAHIRASPHSDEGRSLFWAVVGKFHSQDSVAGMSWAATLPANSQQQAQMTFFNYALSEKKLPEMFAAVEKLPIAQQQVMVGNIAAGILKNTYGDADQDARYVNSLNQVPASLRGVARSVIEKSATGSPERKEAALKALK